MRIALLSSTISIFMVDLALFGKVSGMQSIFDQGNAEVVLETPIDVRDVAALCGFLKFAHAGKRQAAFLVNDAFDIAADHVGNLAESIKNFLLAELGGFGAEHRLGD